MIAAPVPEDESQGRATTNELMGFVGRREGIAAMAAALIRHEAA